MNLLRAGFLVAIVCCGLSAASAHGQDELSGLRACAAVGDDDARLKCYDREVLRATQQQPQEPVAASVDNATPPARSAAPEMTREQAFGYQGSVARAGLDERDGRLNSIDRIEAQVVQIDKRPLGELVVTLANGQVWAQKSPEASRLKVGAQVTIKRASLGSFLLSSPGTRTIQVARIK